MLSGNDLGSGATHINAFGYLADENYFAGCGGGGSSSSTVDSSYIDSLVQFYSGGNGGGCDFQFPEGIDGEGVVIQLVSGFNYTVPAGKRLYILTNHGLSSPVGYHEINGEKFSTNFLPTIAEEGDIISWNTNDINLNCMLIDATNNIDVITMNVGGGTTMTVPAGKRLYINNIGLTGGWTLTIYKSFPKPCRMNLVK